MNKHWTTDPPEIGKWYWWSHYQYDGYTDSGRILGTQFIRDRWRKSRVSEVRSIEPIPEPPPRPTVDDFPLPYEYPYVWDVPSYGDVYTREDWLEMIDCDSCNPDDGTGYPIKDGKMNRHGDVFPPPEDATHVVWFNK